MHQESHHGRIQKERRRRRRLIVVRHLQIREGEMNTRVIQPSGRLFEECQISAVHTSIVVVDHQFVRSKGLLRLRLRLRVRRRRRRRRRRGHVGTQGGGHPTLSSSAASSLGEWGCCGSTPQKQQLVWGSSVLVWL